MTTTEMEMRHVNCIQIISILEISKFTHFFDLDRVWYFRFDGIISDYVKIILHQSGIKSTCRCDLNTSKIGLRPIFPIKC